MEEEVSIQAVKAENTLWHEGVTSKEVKELFGAMSKALGSMDTATKNRTNPHFNSGFADLVAVKDVSRKQLQENGLALTSYMRPMNGGWVLVTLLTHVSGQWMRSWAPINPQKAGPQGFGSDLTYMRRYSKTAMLDMASDEEDDGNAASDASSGSGGGGKPKANHRPLTDKQVNRLYAIAKNAASWTKDHVDQYLKKVHNLDQAKNLSKKQYDALTNMLEQKKPEPPKAQTFTAEQRKAFAQLKEAREANGWGAADVADLAQAIFGQHDVTALSGQDVEALRIKVTEVTPAEWLQEQAEAEKASPLEEQEFKDFVGGGADARPAE